MGVESIEKLFSNRILSELLTIFMTHPDAEFHQRQLASLLDRSRRPVQLNLNRLEQLTIITSWVDGNRISYRANKSSPIFEDVRRIIYKTVGFGQLLRDGLGSLKDRVEIAFIYGSTAEGGDEIDSDIDLLIVGDLTMREAAQAVSGVKKMLQREINLTVYSPREFGDKYRSDHHFVKNVVAGEKIYLIGGNDELRAIYQ